MSENVTWIPYYVVGSYIGFGFATILIFIVWEGIVLARGGGEFCKDEKPLFILGGLVWPIVWTFWIGCALFEAISFSYRSLSNFVQKTYKTPKLIGHAIAMAIDLAFVLAALALLLKYAYSQF